MPAVRARPAGRGAVSPWTGGPGLPNVCGCLPGSGGLSEFGAAEQEGVTGGELAQDAGQ